MENKFKKGIILGGLLAVAAAVGMAFSKKGQALSEELQGDLKHIASKVKKGLAKLEDATKENFDALVTAAVDEYTEKKEMAQDAKDQLVDALKATWNEMEEQYLADREEK